MKLKIENLSAGYEDGAVLQDLTLKDVCEVHTAPGGFGEGYFNEFGEWVSGYFNELDLSYQNHIISRQEYTH